MTAEQVTQWSQIPEDARTGLCQNPTCPILNCVDPLVTVYEDDEGPTIVIASYTLLDGDSHRHCVRVNGEMLADVFESAYAGIASELIAAIEDRFGDRGDRAIHQHASSRKRDRRTGQVGRA